MFVRNDLDFPLHLDLLVPDPRDNCEVCESVKIVVDALLTAARHLPWTQDDRSCGGDRLLQTHRETEVGSDQSHFVAHGVWILADAPMAGQTTTKHPRVADRAWAHRPRPLPLPTRGPSHKATVCWHSVLRSWAYSTDPGDVA